VLLSTAPRRRILGIEVSSLSADEYVQLLFERAGTALALIARYDPNRFDRVQRDLTRIVLIAGGGGFYHPELRACVIDVAHLQDASEAQLAVFITHEAVHARLANCGIPYTGDLQGRIESLCVTEAARFASKLPAGSVLEAETQRALSSPWWTPHQLHQRRASQLRSHGVPEWAVRIYLRLFAPARTGVRPGASN
jgi:hypothetical protein